jgi:hypothetical protein
MKQCSKGAGCGGEHCLTTVLLLLLAMLFLKETAMTMTMTRGCLETTQQQQQQQVVRDIMGQNPVLMRLVRVQMTVKARV